MELVERLRAALDETERDAHEFHQQDCPTVANGDTPFPCECGEPGRRERMVAAHRKILDLHAPTEYRTLRGGVTHVILQCNHCAGLCHSGSGLSCDEPCDAVYPCETVTLVAEAYGDEA